MQIFYGYKIGKKIKKGDQLFLNKNLLLSAAQESFRNTVRTLYLGTSTLGRKCQGIGI